MIILVLIATVLITHVELMCNTREELELCLRPLYLFANPTLPRLQNTKDIDRTCPALEKVVGCAEHYRHFCNDVAAEPIDYFERRYYHILELVNNICTNGHRDAHRAVFLTHASCMKEIANKIKPCVKDYSDALTITNTVVKMNNSLGAEGIIVHYTCCSFLQYFSCVSELVSEICGKRVQPLTRIFFQQIASFMNMENEYITEDCGKGVNINGFYTAVSHCVETNKDREFEIRSKFLTNIQLPNISYWYMKLEPVTFDALHETTPTSQKCGPAELEKCIEPMYAIADPSLSNVSTKEKLQQTCLDVEESIYCLQEYSDNCYINKQIAINQSLLVASLVGDLCSKYQYQNEFLKYAPSIEKTIRENTTCLNRYLEATKNVDTALKIQESISGNHTITTAINKQKLIGYPIVRYSICSFYEYVNCITPTIQRISSKQAADVSKEYFEKIASFSLKSHKLILDCTLTSTDVWKYCLMRGYDINNLL